MALSSITRPTVERYDSRVSPEHELTADLGPGLRPDGPRICSIADALAVVGERYSLLILRELSFGVHRFNDILHNTGAPRETLTVRLKKLEEAGVITRRQYSEHPPRDEYLLTESGKALAPALARLREWGEQYVSPPRN